MSIVTFNDLLSCLCYPYTIGISKTIIETILSLIFLPWATYIVKQNPVLYSWILYVTCYFLKGKYAV